ncbi:hypothetical protein [Neptuniibacter halophilus]|uniref:hypothetical protein n=1 Tax=Neptuniibacter halophilus TaxID=651666 RepID=UPI0025722153|nr:hypothetical protein [Neptuniibacter halophilus]
MLKQMLSGMLLAGIGLSGLAYAAPLEGEKQVLLLDKQGNERLLGQILFQPQGSVSQYELHVDHSQFRDYFLSMKEMKCLEGPELWCHLPYPYTQPHQVSDTDLRWLSHDLLFMFKKPSEFGANFWNGIYYQLELEGDQIRGRAMAVDLNLLASPPESAAPPIGDTELDDIDRSQRWLPDLIIR